MMAESSLRQLLFKNTALQMAGHLVSLALGLATSLILSRYLGVEGFGQLNYIFAFYYFFLSINDFGINTIVVREVSRQPARAQEIIGGMLSFKLLVSAVSVVAAWVAIGLMDFPGELRNGLLVFALILPTIALQLPAVIFQVLLKLEYAVSVGIISRCVGFAFMSASVLAGYGLVAILLAMLLGELAALIVGLNYARKFLRLGWRVDPRVWSEVLRSSIPLGLAGLCGIMINRLNLIMLERMTDLKQVGLYAAAHKVPNLLETFPLMVMVTIYPLMSRYAAEDPARLRALYGRGSFYLAAAAVPMGIGITVFAPAIVRLLFGAAFADADRGLAILVWSTVFLCPALVGGNLLISMGWEKFSLAVNVLGAGLGVVLNLALIPTWGFVGAAVATSLAYLFLLVGTSVGCYMALHGSGSGSRRESDDLEGPSLEPSSWLTGPTE